MDYNFTGQYQPAGIGSVVGSCEPIEAGPGVGRALSGLLDAINELGLSVDELSKRVDPFCAPSQPPTPPQTNTSGAPVRQTSPVVGAVLDNRHAVALIRERVLDIVRRVQP